jgi:predicted AAA+ superfamily ATPase
MGIIRTGSRSFTADYGARFENFVFNQLRIAGGDMYYFSGKNRECDFIVNPQGSPERGTRCVQACYELTGDNQGREIAGLCAAMDFFGVSEGIIITRDTRDIILEGGKKIAVVPAWDWAAKIEAATF